MAAKSEADSDTPSRMLGEVRGVVEVLVLEEDEGAGVGDRVLEGLFLLICRFGGVWGTSGGTSGGHNWWFVRFGGFCESEVDERWK